MRTHPAPPFGLTKSASILDTDQHREPRCSAQALYMIEEVTLTINWAAEHEIMSPRPARCACLLWAINGMGTTWYITTDSPLSYTHLGVYGTGSKRCVD